MLSVPLTLFLLVLFFGLTIFVHELGHFLAAKSLGLVIDTFSLGFGPALWQTKRKGVVYKIACLPFGGYVALPQIDHAAPDHARQDGGQRKLPPVEPWKKIVVSVAGATGNVVLAFLLSGLLFVTGKPSTPGETSARIGFVSEDSAAFDAGLRPGDLILSVNGESVARWQDFSVLSTLRQELVLWIARIDPTDGEIKEFEVTLPTAEGFAGVRKVDGLAPVEYCKVLAPMPGSSAERAGVQPGDLIMAFDRQRVYSIPQLISLVNQRPGQETPLTVHRNGEELTLRVTPEQVPGEEVALIGVRFNPYFVDATQRVHVSPLVQMRQHAGLIFRVLRALVTPGEARQASRALGGPPAILVSLWMIVRSSFLMGLWFTAFLNVNLAILNLLPIPVLDGGHILFSTMEMLFRRKLPARMVNALTMIFMVLLMGLIVFLSLRDVSNLWALRRGAPSRSIDTEAVPVEPAGEE